MGLGTKICKDLRLVRGLSENHASCLLGHHSSHGNLFLEKLSSLAFFTSQNANKLIAKFLLELYGLELSGDKIEKCHK